MRSVRDKEQQTASKFAANEEKLNGIKRQVKNYDESKKDHTHIIKSQVENYEERVKDHTHIIKMKDVKKQHL